MNNETLVEGLRFAARSADGIAKNYGGKVGTVFGVASAALDAAAALAAEGEDPVLGIRRVLSADPYLTEVHSRWDDSLDAKFGPSSRD